MRRITTSLLLLCSLLLPATASATSPYSVHYIESVDGARIRVEIQRNPAFDSQRQPVILTYSPYNNIPSAGDGQSANDSLAGGYNNLGYARAVADVIGTRGSTGCWDYGGEAEIQSGIDVVKFLAGKKPDEDGTVLEWASGKVAMIGGSYNGTTATMVASRGDEVPELAAIVPQAAISRWYGYAYENGVRYFLNSFAPTDEGFDTPLAFDFGFGRTVEPMDAETRPEDLADQAVARTGECGAAEHTAEAYSRNPDYGDFWLARDYIADADFRAAALIAHGWQDFNVKQRQAIDLWKAMPLDDPRTASPEGVPFKLLWMTQGTHSGATNGAQYAALEREFFAHTLKDTPLSELDTLRAHLASPVHTVSSTSSGISDERYETSWPPPGTTEQTLFLDRWFDYDLDGVPQNGLVGSTGETGVLGPEPQDTGAWTWVDTGAASELVVENDPLNEPGHGYYSLYWQTPPLETATRLAGSAVVDAWIRNTAGAGTHFTPVLLDVAPDGSMEVVQRGFMNLDYRNGLSESDPMPADTWQQVEVAMLPGDHVFEAGHRIGLLTMSSNTIWAVPGTAGGLTNIATGTDLDGEMLRSSLRLPIVGGALTFSDPVPAAPSGRTTETGEATVWPQWPFRVRPV